MPQTTAASAPAGKGEAPSTFSLLPSPAAQTPVPPHGAQGSQRARGVTSQPSTDLANLDAEVAQWQIWGEARGWLQYRAGVSSCARADLGWTLGGITSQKGD